MTSDVVEIDPALLDPKRWKALGVIAIAQLMVVLDASIVNLALPSAKRALHISNANQQWVITAYTLAFGGLLLLGGRIADYVGRKRIFIVGLLGFAAASALGGMAPSAAWLFGARALQGAFGALLAPAALSLITVNFILPKERAKAFGVFGAIAGGGAAIGLLLGGVLTQYFSWRWCLGVNVPIAIIAASLAVPFVTESKATGAHSYDLPGALTATLGLVSLVYGFTKAALDGWSSPVSLTFFAIALLLLVAFVLIELRTKSPLLPMRVLLERNRGGSYLASLIVGAGLFAMFLFLGLYLQVILGYSPVKSGFAFLPFSITIILTAGLAANLLPKIGPRPLMVTGLFFAAVGLLYLTRITPLTSYATHVLPAMVLMSFGLALVFIPLSTTALHDVGHDDAGVASALINTSQQVGGSLGTALLNTVAATATSSYAAAHTSMGKMLMPFALTHGYTNAFKAGAAMLALAAVVIFFTIRVGKDSLVERDEIAHFG
ncbi:putative MFS-type transporter EfpA [mine drainage metagenome]|uniref:Putative MFS-type transporter EfpA n=1 Tax=mine drainage metagenome TaxID=410659 RepID=A0A1J5QR74_9ZZZZ